MQVSLGFGFGLLFLYTDGALFHVEQCTRQRLCPSIIFYKVASIAHDQYTDIYSLLNIHIYTYAIQGKDGIKNLFTKFRSTGPQVFYYGSLAAAGATYVGHYPWFLVYNTLSEKLPQPTNTVEK